jgi:hypothetical protein
MRQEQFAPARDDAEKSVRSKKIARKYLSAAADGH